MNSKTAILIGLCLLGASMLRAQIRTENPANPGLVNNILHPYFTHDFQEARCSTDLPACKPAPVIYSKQPEGITLSGFLANRTPVNTLGNQPESGVLRVDTTPFSTEGMVKKTEITDPLIVKQSGK